MKITFIGHSTILMECGKTAVITDPLFVKRIALVKLKMLPALQVKDLPHLSAVTISHAHADHLNLKSLAKFDKKIKVIVPEYTAPILQKAGFSDITELKTWESIDVGEFKIVSTPVNHVKGRLMPWSKTGVAGYVFQCGKHSVLVTGDVDFGDMSYFNEIGEKFDLNAVFLPVGGMREVAFYEKRRGKKGVHIDPSTALDAFVRCKADIMVPVHWGSLTIAKTPRDEAPKRLLELAEQKNMKEKIKVLYPGESFFL